MLKVRVLASLRGGWFPACLIASAVSRLSAQTDQQVYTDSLQNSWNNWSWGSTINLGNTSPVYDGSSSISITITNGYAALYLEHTAFDSTPYTNLTFWVHGGSSAGQPLAVRATLGGTVTSNQYNFSPTASTWQQITVPLSSLGVASQPNLDGIWIQSQSGSALSTFYVDDMTLLTNGAPPPPPVTNSVTINVDAQLNRHPISPLIYGVAFASTAQLSDLNSPLNRSGGNAETRYNWLIDAHNRAADFYFESIGDSAGTPAASDDTFVSTSKSGGAEPILTIPMIGWAPKLGPSRAKLASYSIVKYGPQTGNDASYFPDAGNGVGTNATAHTSWLITTNDPNDANFATNSALQQALVQHLTNRWGLSTNGGVKYYLMDNEHSIWFSTHRDVHPIGPTMQEIRDKFFDYAGKVKAADPSALVGTPEEWGWSGYFYSGYDQQNSGNHDRANNGGWDYGPWLLNQFYQRATNTNQRLLDYFTFHCYPQGGESGNDVSTSTQMLRNRSTRQLWDTNYVDASWIGSQPTNNILKLIPRMKNWVATFYPGTKTGITEYNWGAEANINGGTAQADIFGIFGREGLDLATRWTTPGSGTPTYNAMKLYRNYDGSKSTFGDLSVNATAPNPDIVSTFAALRSSDNALTLMVINKQLSASATATVTITNRLLNGSGQVWQLTSANTITRLSDISFTANVFSNTLPPQSITLFVLPAGVLPPPPQLQAGAMSPTNTFDLWLYGTAGQRYVILSSSNLVNWVPVQTNTLSSSSWHLVLPATNGPRSFYRGQWAP
ncbi:MAG TPA: glycoside hydrolase family 44 protein [Candidatus Binatia bacterium]|jgi:hypothetical protein|nr:glycoside hydrolase family 44 protein [Candidatus Binatia bacterium]